MPTIDFKTAIAKAKDGAMELLGDIQNVNAESVLLSDDSKNYEVTLSYDLKGHDPLSIQKEYADDVSLLEKMIGIMSYRKNYKIFIIDKNNGELKGFKTQNI